MESSNYEIQAFPKISDTVIRHVSAIKNTCGSRTAYNKSNVEGTCFESED